jgi:hypothetical protein
MRRGWPAEATGPSTCCPRALVSWTLSLVTHAQAAQRGGLTPPPPRAELALPEESFSYFFDLLLTVMVLGLASGALGMVSVRTPSSKSASALSASTPSGRARVRENDP